MIHQKRVCLLLQNVLKQSKMHESSLLPSLTFIIIIMTNSKKQKLITVFFRTRAQYYRYSRLLFPSAAEVRFVEIMGGRFYQLSWLKHYQTKRPLTIIVSLGKALEQEKFGREVRAGRYYIDFANDINMAVEVDGHAYHRDVVREFDRESYLYQRGWRIIHIPAIKLWNDPSSVQQKVLAFLYK